MGLRTVLLLLAFALLGVVPADAADQTVRLRNCRFSSSTVFADPGDTVTFRYDEPPSSRCFSKSHRVKSSATPAGEGFDSSPDGACDSSGSLDQSCLNSAFGSSSWPNRFDRPGTYVYYCPFHGQPSQDGNDCGMCGKVIVQAPPTLPPPSSPPATTPPPPPTTPATTKSASPSATTTVSPSPTAASSVLADRKTAGAGPRVALALTLVGVLAGLAIVVYRALVAQRPS